MYELAAAYFNSTEINSRFKVREGVGIEMGAWCYNFIAAACLGLFAEERKKTDSQRCRFFKIHSYVKSFAINIAGGTAAVFFIAQLASLRP